MNLTTAITRLLTSAQLRHDFRCNTDELANRLEIRGRDRVIFDSIDADDLDRQAECLLNKRFHEVSCIVPRTIKSLGHDARQRFHCYATDFWPTGHLRHWIDADEFCDWVLRNGKDRICRAEWNWVRFCLSRQRFAVHVVIDLVVVGRPRVALQVFTRGRSGSPRWRLLYFHLPKFAMPLGRLCGLITVHRLGSDTVSRSSWPQTTRRSVNEVNPVGDVTRGEF